MQKIVIIGATSAIAQEAAKLFAAQGKELFLVARSGDKLAAVAEDLRVRGARAVEILALDLGRLEQHQNLLEQAITKLGGVDAVLIAHGTLGDQQQSQQSVEKTLKELNINFLSVVSLCTLWANYFEKQQAGCLAVISSVAGDRGRQSNYVYGTAKAGVSAFLQGLRNRLFASGVSVVTIKPGFVDTPMTAHIKKNPLFASPEKVGKVIYYAMKNGKDVVYVPWFWCLIMMIIKSIPERIFKKLKL